MSSNSKYIPQNEDKVLVLYDNDDIAGEVILRKTNDWYVAYSNFYKKDTGSFIHANSIALELLNQFKENPIKLKKAKIQALDAKKLNLIKNINCLNNELIKINQSIEKAKLDYLTYETKI